VKICQFVTDVYPHVFISFSQFILLFNKMALIFLEALVILPF